MKLDSMPVGIFLASIVSLIATGCFSDRFERRQPFFKRYELATDIIYGKVIEVSESRDEIEEFKGLNQKDTKKVTLEIIRSWKGAKSGMVTFWASYSSRVDGGVDARKKQSQPLKPGTWLIVFLRELNGKKVSEIDFGQWFFNVLSDALTYSEYKALDILHKGSSMEVALKGLEPFELRAFKNAKK